MLGPLDVAAGDRRLPLTAVKQRALLAALLIDLNRVVPVDRLVEALWGDDPPASVNVTLRSLVSRLRSLLESAGDGGVVLRAAPPGYVLETDPERVDAHRFQRLSACARRALGDGDHTAALAALREGLSLWRGPALGDLADLAFTRSEADRLAEARRAAIEDLAEAELSVGLYDDAIARLEAHTAENPFRERPWGQLMLALSRAGRQTEALRTYQDVRRMFGEELGIEPGPGLRQLEQQILLQRLDVRHNLPVMLSRFVGRDHERRRLAELVGSSRLVTLTGAGGVGKTRLSLEVARGLLPSFADGVFFVDLAPVTDPSLVAPQLVSVLGLAIGSEQATPSGVVDRLAEHLARRQVLLVLDNCEHVIAAVRALVDPLLRRCPPLVVLATSRERLSVSGESVWRVPSLSDNDAMALCCDRARALDPDFALGDHNTPDIARICRQLDGIPLAIELATARLGILRPVEIADRLDNRLRLLTAGRRAALPRQQTLAALIDFSHELLSGPERGLLRRLGVFAGTFETARRCSSSTTASTWSPRVRRLPTCCCVSARRSPSSPPAASRCASRARRRGASRR